MKTIITVIFLVFEIFPQSYDSILVFYSDFDVESPISYSCEESLGNKNKFVVKNKNIISEICRGLDSSSAICDCNVDSRLKLYFYSGGKCLKSVCMDRGAIKVNRNKVFVAHKVLKDTIFKLQKIYKVKYWRNSPLI